MLAAIQTSAGFRRSMYVRRGESGSSSRGMESYLRFPVTCSRPAGAPIARYRSRMRSFCTRTASGQCKTSLKNQRNRR